MFFLYCKVSVFWRQSKFRMQIFKGKGYLLRKANTVLFLFVTVELVSTIHPGRKREHTDKSRKRFSSLLPVKLKLQTLPGRGKNKF